MLISRLIILTFINLVTNSALPFYALAMDVEGSSSVESSNSIEDQASTPNKEIEMDSKKRPRDPSPLGSESSHSPPTKQPKSNHTRNRNLNPNVGMQTEEKKEKKETNNEIKTSSNPKFSFSFTPPKSNPYLNPKPLPKLRTSPPQERAIGKDKEKEEKEKINEKSLTFLIEMERPSNQQEPIFYPKTSESGRTIGEFIINELNRAKKQIVIGCEQLTDDNLVYSLIQKNNHILVHILVGDNLDGSRAEERLNKNSQICTFTAISNDGNRSQGEEKLKRNCIRAVDNKKMHNKFIIIDDKVFINSPNATTNAYTNNVESLVRIHDFELANLYAQYFEYIIKTAGTYQSKSDNIIHLTEGDKILYEMRESLHKYNLKKNGKIKVCLAPINKIVDFIK